MPRNFISTRRQDILNTFITLQNLISQQSRQHKNKNNRTATLNSVTENTKQDTDDILKQIQTL
jgi:hypothetical protein